MNNHRLHLRKLRDVICQWQNSSSRDPVFIADDTSRSLIAQAESLSNELYDCVCNILSTIEER